MELGESIGGQIIENLDNRGSDNRGSTIIKICNFIALIHLTQKNPKTLYTLYTG